MVAKLIGRYQIISVLGRGGMATVYRAFDPLFEREVAVKILPPDPGNDPSRRARFEREAKTIASLEHPAIVPVYDVGEEAGQSYLVMRLMMGGSLTDRIREGPVALPEIARLLARLAPALDEAHARGVIHRDLKPANILFDQRGDPFLSDFGIAKLAESSTILTVSGVIGTPAYMSPEQARGDRTIGASSDLYSLGVILFELLTGQQPYQAETPTGQMFKHVHEPIPSVRMFKPDLSRAFDEVLQRAMAKEPAGRYTTAQEMAQAINSAVRAGTLPLRELPPEPDPAATFVERRPDFSGRREEPAPAWQQPAAAPRPPATVGTGEIKPQRRRSGRLAVYGFLAAAVFLFLVIGGAGLLFLAPNFFRGAQDRPPGTEPPGQSDQVQEVASTPGIILGEAVLGTLPVTPTLAAPSQAPTVTLAPTATRLGAIVPTNTLPPGQPVLVLDKNYFCRGGPGTDSDQIWSFSQGTELEITGKSDNGWWLVRFEDDRTSHDQCWISGGTVVGDPAAVPRSEFRTFKQPPGAADTTAQDLTPAPREDREPEEADTEEPTAEEPATEEPPTEEPYPSP